MDEEIVVSVKHVSKDFILLHERANSVKSLFTNAFRFEKNKAKETQHALRNISLEVKKGEFFGIVGRNGSGKSTLLKILAGIYQPTTGSVEKVGRLVPFIELGVGFSPELSGRDNVYLNGAMMGFSKKEVSAMYDEIVAFAELEEFMDKKLKNYSSGMQVRLAFSMATRAQADILLVDEVLAVGDADFQKKCFTYFKDLKREKKTVIFVSHDMHAVEEYCDRAVLIEDSEVIVRGTSREVATAYTRMFLEQRDNISDLMKKKKRWGSNEVTYDSVVVEPSKIGDDKQIRVRTVATVHKDTEEAVLGFSIRGGDDRRMLGTNNKLKKKHLKQLKKGQKITMTWEVPNVFTTGNYAIDVAIQSEDYTDVYDSWDDAGRLQVERSEDSSYPVQPIITLSIAENER
jgi:ABC-2 type transport system ATP-binding protein